MTKIKIDIHTNGFKGDYLILEDGIQPAGKDKDGNKYDHWINKTQNGPLTNFELSPGKYRFFVRGGVGRCDFLFKVDSTGEVVSSSEALRINPKSATSDNPALALKTQKITVHPAGFSGQLRTNLRAISDEVSFGNHPDCQSAEFTVIQGLLFYFTNNASREATLVGGTVSADGIVEPNRPNSAIGGVQSLTFITTAISLFNVPKDSIEMTGYQSVEADATGNKYWVIRGMVVELKKITSAMPANGEIKFVPF